MSDGLNDLCALLKNLSPGRVRADVVTRIEDLLADCWKELDCEESEAMYGSKLKNRMERVQWRPPELIFVIERHYGLQIGSTDDAELQKWSVDIVKGTARLKDLGWRRLRSPDYDEDDYDEEGWYEW